MDCPAFVCFLCSYYVCMQRLTSVDGFTRVASFIHLKPTNSLSTSFCLGGKKV